LNKNVYPDSQSNSALGGDCSVCVILFCHNQVQYLASHAAVLRQSKSNIDQVLIVDIASNNPIHDTVKRDFADFPCCGYTRHEQNIGIVAAMNLALAQVRTAFVHFLAADDKVTTGFYQSFKNLVAKHPHAGVFSSAYDTMNEDGGDLAKFRIIPPATVATYLSPRQVRDAMVRNDSWFAGHAIILNVNYLRTVGGFDPELGAFSDAYVIYFLALGNGALFDPASLAIKRLHNNQMGNEIYTEAHTLVLLETVLCKMRSEAGATVFDAQFVSRFVGRWRFKIDFAKRNGGMAQTRRTPYTELMKLYSVLRYRPFDLLNILKNRFLSKNP
jgi:hypothetical protein